MKKRNLFLLLFASVPAYAGPDDETTKKDCQSSHGTRLDRVIQKEGMDPNGKKRILPSILSFLNRTERISLASTNRYLFHSVDKTPIKENVYSASYIKKMMTKEQSGNFYQMYHELGYHICDTSQAKKEKILLSFLQENASDRLEKKPGFFKNIFPQKNPPSSYYRLGKELMCSGPLFLNLTGFDLTSEIVLRLKTAEPQLPLWGDIELLRHKEMWPQIVGLSFHIQNEEQFSKADIDLLKEFAAQECSVEKVAIMMKYAPQDTGEEKQQGSQRTFLNLITELYTMNLGCIKEISLRNPADPGIWMRRKWPQDFYQRLAGFRLVYESDFDDNPLTSVSRCMFSLQALSRFPNLELFHTNLQGFLTSLNPDDLQKIGKMPHLNHLIVSEGLDPDAFIKQLIQLPPKILTSATLNLYSSKSTLSLLRHFSNLKNMSLQLAVREDMGKEMYDLIEALNQHPELMLHLVKFQAETLDVLEKFPKRLQGLRLSMKNPEKFAILKTLLPDYRNLSDLTFDFQKAETLKESVWEEEGKKLVDLISSMPSLNNISFVNAPMNIVDYFLEKIQKGGIKFAYKSASKDKSTEYIEKISEKIEKIFFQNKKSSAKYYLKSKWNGAGGVGEKTKYFY